MSIILKYAQDELLQLGKLELPKIPWEQRLGNLAEDNVQARFSCFSNPTKIQTDVGIDFSCELLVFALPRHHTKYENVMTIVIY